MKQLFLLVFLIPPIFGGSFNVNQDVIRAPLYLGRIDLAHQDDHFYVKHEGQTKQVARYNMCNTLRRLSPEAINKVLNHGNSLLYLKKMSDDNFSLELHRKLIGGTGIITSVTVGLITRILFYTGLISTAALVIDDAVKSESPFPATLSAIAIAGSIPTVVVSIETAAIQAALITLALPIPLP